MRYANISHNSTRHCFPLFYALAQKYMRETQLNRLNIQIETLYEVFINDAKRFAQFLTVLGEQALR